MKFNLFLMYKLILFCQKIKLTLDYRLYKISQCPHPFRFIFHNDIHFYLYLCDLKLLLHYHNMWMIQSCTQKISCSTNIFISKDGLSENKWCSFDDVMGFYRSNEIEKIKAWLKCFESENKLWDLMRQDLKIEKLILCFNMKKVSRSGSVSEW